MSRDHALVLRPGEARQLSLGSMQLSFKADGAESDGRYALSVATADADSPGASPHVHREHDDIFFVIDGTLAFTVAGDLRGCCRNAGRRPARARAPLVEPCRSRAALRRSARLETPAGIPLVGIEAVGFEHAFA